MEINRIITLKTQVSGMSPTNNNLQEALTAAIDVIIELVVEVGELQWELAEQETLKRERRERGTQ